MSNDNEEFHRSGNPAKLSRRSLLRAATAGAAAAPVPWLVAGASQADAQPPAAIGDAAATDPPGLPNGFWTTFTSRRVRANRVTLHAVTGGHGPAVLLICGWPQTWYAWRHVMRALARDFSVVAVDPRGVGLSDKPASGYDSATLADDSVKLMNVLGHERFALVTHDVGAWTGYALAADHPQAVERFVAMETITPGLTEPGPLLLPAAFNNLLWHFPFNRVVGINEQLVQGREDIYFGYQFASKAATPSSVPAEAVRVYIDALRRPGALRSSFEFYRAIDDIIAQNNRRKTTKLTLPVLAVGGEHAIGSGVETEMRTVAENVSGVIIPGSGHFLMDENPEQVISALAPFLAPYRR
jgi:pimeloyl-ACP methyl ester carboxylesterase